MAKKPIKYRGPGGTIKYLRYRAASNITNEYPRCPSLKFPIPSKLLRYEVMPTSWFDFLPRGLRRRGEEVGKPEQEKVGIARTLMGEKRSWRVERDRPKQRVNLESIEEEDEVEDASNSYLGRTNQPQIDMNALTLHPLIETLAESASGSSCHEADGSSNMSQIEKRALVLTQLETGFLPHASNYKISDDLEEMQIESEALAKSLFGSPSSLSRDNIDINGRRPQIDTKTLGPIIDRLAKSSSVPSLHENNDHKLKSQAEMRASLSIMETLSKTSLSTSRKNPQKTNKSQFQLEPPESVVSPVEPYPGTSYRSVTGKDMMLPMGTDSHATFAKEIAAGTSGDTSHQEAENPKDSNNKNLSTREKKVAAEREMANFQFPTTLEADLNMIPVFGRPRFPKLRTRAASIRQPAATSINAQPSHPALLHDEAHINLDNNTVTVYTKDGKRIVKNVQEWQKETGIAIPVPDSELIRQLAREGEKSLQKTQILVGLSKALCPCTHCRTEIDTARPHVASRVHLDIMKDEWEFLRLGDAVDIMDNILKVEGYFWEKPWNAFEEIQKKLDEVAKAEYARMEAERGQKLTQAALLYAFSYDPRLRADFDGLSWNSKHTREDGSWRVPQTMAFKIDQLANVVDIFDTSTAEVFEFDLLLSSRYREYLVEPGIILGTIPTSLTPPNKSQCMRYSRRVPVRSFEGKKIPAPANAKTALTAQPQIKISPRTDSSNQDLKPPHVHPKGRSHPHRAKFPTHFPPASTVAPSASTKSTNIPSSSNPSTVSFSSRIARLPRKEDLSPTDWRAFINDCFGNMDFDNLEEELMKVGLTDEENQQLDKCFEERKRTGAFKPMPWSVDRKFQRALKNYMMRERDGEEFMRQFGKWYR